MTAAKTATEPTNAPETTGDGAIIVRGEKVVLPRHEVHTWHDTGLLFEPDIAPLRDDRARWMVHWTGSERSGEAGARTVFRSLKSRRLSVDFLITNEGAIWQFFDPDEQRGRHCSRLNRQAVGIEVSNTGWLASNKQLYGPVAGRRQYEAAIHGWRTRVFDFLPAQQRSLNALVAALLRPLCIERRVLCAPWERRPAMSYADGASGVCGHMHGASYRIRNPKIDPGPAPLERLKTYLEQSAVE